MVWAHAIGYDNESDLISPVSDALAETKDALHRIGVTVVDVGSDTTQLRMASSMVQNKIGRLGLRTVNDTKSVCTGYLWVQR